MGVLNWSSCLPGKAAISMLIKRPHLEPQPAPSEHISSLIGNISSWFSEFLCFWKIWLFKNIYYNIYYLYLHINIKFIINKRSVQTKASGIAAIPGKKVVWLCSMGKKLTDLTVGLHLLSVSSFPWQGTGKEHICCLGLAIANFYLEWSMYFNC